MIVTLQTERVQTLADVRAVIDGNDRLDYQFTDREAAYEFIRRTLVRFDYPTLSKPDKGVIGRYLAKMTGLSRAQMTRLVGQHRATGRVTDRRGGAPVRPFERRYTGADIRLLAEVDAALGDMSGPATRAVMRREFEVFGQRRFERLARLSNGHLYNLRRSRTYQRKRTTFTKTRPTPVAIGERRKPRPDGQPGFLRVDTVHQGDLDGVKGVYHINTVDEVTQYEHIGCVQAISERFLLPVLEANLRAYPFQSRDSTPTMAPSTSTNGSRRCSTSCISASSPSPAPASPTTTPSSRAKTPPSCANTSDTTTSPNASPPGSTPSPMTCYRRSSTTIDPACSPPNSVTTKGKSKNATATRGTDQNRVIHLYTHERACPEARSARGRTVRSRKGAPAPGG